MGTFRWRPTSQEELKSIEADIHTHVKTPPKGYYVKINDNNDRLWTVQLDPPENGNQKNPPLVMIHGFAAGSGIWIMNYDSLCTHRQVLSFDLLGFGRSDRPPVSTVPEEAENLLIDSIESWRKAVHLDDKFILLGHSFGAYLAMSYAMKYPENISHVILCDPWGMAVTPPKRWVAPSTKKPVPQWYIWVANTFFKNFTPLALLRAAGPYGPGLIQKARPDLKSKFQEYIGEEGAINVLKYIYHCNAQTPPSGESAFKSLSGRIGMPLKPMIDRVTQLSSDINLSFIYGSKSWIDRQAAFDMKEMMPERKISIDVIEGAGHHVYADNVAEFNRLVNNICKTVSEEVATGSQ